ncbi:PLP-dependent aminotransferase family protein [Aromatoleum petrolei]|uniref:Aminotransferase class I/II-fold pyridoxal phosphate-dependent enzyme n=1 Tax=Aromatoleum petrolei TaxID=76116 RepID=A0ABX1MLA6_9RHOO|nr:PLP-dependent aminotransferase family protein [Aromatoleum petrolei]NMF88518.1 aminotransferase class I/II-fold pyridoxal phosphate-dependent enzyme [Aromatoleum petrolei]QTQ36905.1 Putative transcriptional regulator, GntR-type [Aromatoleum petrolei]
MLDDSQPLYQSLALELRHAMTDGRLASGERLPSVREAAKSRGLSINTVLAAYRQLEAHGLIEARPQSGYFVRSRLPTPAAPRFAAASTTAKSAEAEVLDQISRVVVAQASPDTIDLSLACPKGSDFYPGERLGRLVSDLARRRPELLSDYCLPPGSLLLRREICRHAQDLAMSLEPENIILTNGCMEALQFALRTVTGPGDTIALESPTYFNLIPLAERLGLKTIEVPTHPESGMSLDALELLLSERRVQAVVAMPNVHNPLGTSMPVEGKKRLAELANEYRVPVIEDALYAELQYATPLQPTAKAFDRDGWVIVCASYTKTLAPGFRVGWMEGGRFRRELNDLKFCSSVSQPALLCEALGVFLESGGYAQHLRRLRRTYAGQVERLRGLIDGAFPAGTQATRPTGGFLLWVQLPAGCDSNRLFDTALARGISITPGQLFSPGGRYTRHIRLSGCYPFSDRHVHALMTLGELAARQL